ncbi:elongation factor TS-domain-containing protein [Phanerochaete sordida]|uniref:Elongation factor Ts, mitochondrial n=1 Tax=Phanerochaete sordida TaxID=48140 RepID=A0A9P3LD60_9APHY|nr:elongation factor TS-domain-containing protein [Phanerochaete sordida]
MFTRAALPSLRLYSTSAPPNVPVKLIAELRKRTEVSISKAREALAASDNSVDAAFQWLQEDLIKSGAKKAEKLADRLTKQGMVGVSVLQRGLGDGTVKGKGGIRAAMVEVNCETDFVGRNARFDALVTDIAHTVAFMTEAQNSGNLIRPVPLELLKDAPLMSASGEQQAGDVTVGSAIHDSIARFGEMITLGRAVAVVQDPLPQGLGVRVGSYAHGSVDNPNNGQIGTLAVLALKSAKLGELIAAQAFRDDLAKLERSLARQIVGFPTTTLKPREGEEDEWALYEQDFMMFPESNGAKVKESLRQWASSRGIEEEGGVEVVDFAKWTVGGA